jgi:hypothetical protein
MTKHLYTRLALLVDAILRCRAKGMTDWEKRHMETLRELVKEHMPSGGGFDAGTRLDEERSTSEKLVFITSYHHMNDGGYYDGWTEHTVVITPSLAFHFDLKVTGKDRRDIKEYIAEVFHASLLIEDTVED